MRDVGSDDESSDDDGAQGGYAARRRKVKKGDIDETDDALHGDNRKRREGGEDLDENFQLESDEDGEDEDERLRRGYVRRRI